MDKKVKQIRDYLNICILAFDCMNIFGDVNKESPAYKVNELHKLALKETENLTVNTFKIEVIFSEINSILTESLKNK